ncbi:hypothetical protein CNMCM5623_005546 [Aspergillus felis]|uniref:DASH complex subunit SPC19 n=1 Tax=Aspergillus felis TaxID=1287682 RepID=A0A8H6UNS0_9EURO|nr:hypothetical protein CNMCM5623_005546 [Aspergillus felis]KAF7177200.1 hypothetical protein CNMCM7691_005022 [Aspergillus felis]
MAASLQASVDSLQSSLQTIDSSISTLDSAVSDFPRLCKVLQSTRHFELLPEPTLREAQQSLLDEITPSIAHLLSLASNHVEKLSRREQALKAKCELQEGRLHSSDNRQSSSRGLGVMRDRQRPDGSSAVAKAAEYRRLVQKKERLKYTVERLELQSQQRERQLRKRNESAPLFQGTARLAGPTIKAGMPFDPYQTDFARNSNVQTTNRRLCRFELVTSVVDQSCCF